MLMVGNTNVIEIVKNATMFHETKKRSIVIRIGKPSDKLFLVIFEELLQINASHFLSENALGFPKLTGLPIVFFIGENVFFICFLKLFYRTGVGFVCHDIRFS